MESKIIRKKFLEFFKSKEHQIVSSAPIVNKNDPTLMFTNAGMNQFKDYFLGNKVPTSRRVADTQKCLRVSGKHNDLEEVGIDTYHHTMFEMLGNWSFGDYFKEESIQWSWDLLTEEFKLPKDRIYVTVFGGDPAENLQPDNEAYQLWKKIVPEDRILYGSKKDNFWEMGDQGPCGPASEIHIDLRPEEEIAKIPGKNLVNEDHPLVVEIWNIVFIQYNRKADSSLEPLPEKHIDTGMGFERLVMAIQNKTSNYDTDVFQPLIKFIADHAGKKYGQNPQDDIAMRVLSDHIRAISFTIADGQLPSNNKAGYVIRRILRRAVRYAYTFLNFREPFLYKMVPLLAKQFEEVFPELKEQQDFVQKVIQEEESSFLRTLENGLKRLEQIKAEINGKTDTIDGKTVFELYDTFGFPLDLTALIARENGLKIDEEGFQEEMAQQKDRSRKAATTETGDWQLVHAEEHEPEFIGYDHLQSASSIVKYRKVKAKKKEQYQVVLDTTPFYAESGGQVGDTGYLEVGSEKIPVTDTKRENDLIIHLTDKLPADPKAEVNAVVDVKKRQLTKNNHTATHLLHAALRQVLGDHVTQKGSFVNDKVLRFDFSHFSKLSDEELTEIEKIVNKKIRENIPLDEKRNVPIEEAQKLGAMALFGEKYGDFVRVITFDPKYSVELCGGTHVQATGEIGFFKIVSESSVAAGVRRIEAVTADEAEKYVNQNLDVLNLIRATLKTTGDPVKAVGDLLEEKNTLAKQVEAYQGQEGQTVKEALLEKSTNFGGINCIIESLKISSADTLKNIAFELRNQVENLYLVLAAEIEGRPHITVMLSDNIVKERSLNAGKIVKDLAKEIQGGGGGQPFYATAGGKNSAGLPKVTEKATEFIKSTVA
ncbi:alanine--tRNA ligase [Cytophagaceae bacterium ABcell3]|nr:alanine--tRNA ligase [Cytophagaceae bacterium ABcell3]